MITEAVTSALRETIDLLRKGLTVKEARDTLVGRGYVARSETPTMRSEMLFVSPVPLPAGVTPTDEMATIGMVWARSSIC